MTTTPPAESLADYLAFVSPDGRLAAPKPLCTPFDALYAPGVEGEVAVTLETRPLGKHPTNLQWAKADFKTTRKA